jgi:predicted nucleic acid-binding protein
VPDSVFVDTAGWASLFIATEPHFPEAAAWFRRARQRQTGFATTNHVLLELLALQDSARLRVLLGRQLLCRKGSGFHRYCLSALVGISAIKERNALLTLSESGKYARTSGSNITAPSASVKCWTLTVPSASLILTV